MLPYRKLQNLLLKHPILLSRSSRSKQHACTLREAKAKPPQGCIIRWRTKSIRSCIGNLHPRTRMITPLSKQSSRQTTPRSPRCKWANMDITRSGCAPTERQKKQSTRWTRQTFAICKPKAGRRIRKLSSNPYSRFQQKRAIRKEYAAAQAGKATGIRTQQTVQKTEKAATKAVTVVKRTADQLRRNPKVLLIGP